MSGDDLHFGFGVPQEASGAEKGGPGSEDLANVLRAWRAPEPSEAFRAAVRNNLQGLQQRRTEAGQEPSLGRTLKAWEAPPPSDEFQQSLREQFLRGETGTGVVHPFRESAGDREVPGRSGPPVWMRVVPLLAAAALVLWITTRGDDRAKSSGGVTAAPQVVAGLWSLPDGVPAQGLRLDGALLAANQPADSANVAAALQSGAWIQAPAEEPLRLAYGRLFQVLLAPGSRLDLRGVQEDRDDRSLRLAMDQESGGYAIGTGPDFKPGQYELVFATPDAEVLVTGTVFAVDRYPSGTCVCCAEGSVVVQGEQGQATTTAGRSHFVRTSGTCHDNGEISHEHLAPMERLMGAEPPPGW